MADEIGILNGDGTFAPPTRMPPLSKNMARFVPVDYALYSKKQLEDEKAWHDDKLKKIDGAIKAKG